MQSKQSQVWLLAALAAPIAHFSGCGWLTVLITAALVLPLAILEKDWSFSRPVAYTQILWLGIVAGSLLPGAAACWPSDNSVAVPLTLLALAALTGAAKAPWIGAVLAFAMGLLALPVALSGAAYLKPQWLPPTPIVWNPVLVLVFLLSSLPAAGKGKGKGIWSVGILAVAIAVLEQGTLSSYVAASLTDPEYQTARALGYLEPVVAAALTMGWFSVASVLFASAADIAQKSGISQRLSYVLVWGTGLPLIVFTWQLPAPFLMGLSAFLWCFTPFFQKMKKVKNSA